VLTTEPQPAVYSDARFLTGYESIHHAAEYYEQEPDYVLHYPAVLPCWTVYCTTTRTSYEQKLEQEYDLVFSEECGDVRKIYKRK